MEDKGLATKYIAMLVLMVIVITVVLVMFLKYRQGTVDQIINIIKGIPDVEFVGG